MEALLAGADIACLQQLAADISAVPVEKPVVGPVLSRPGKLLCVGLNYKAHAMGCSMELPEVLFSFPRWTPLSHAIGRVLSCPPWETSYDYEAELVIVIGQDAWNVTEEQADSCLRGRNTV